MAPPQEVADAFRDVTAAREDSQRTDQRSPRLRQPPAAPSPGRGPADAPRSRSLRATQVIKIAQGDAERFTNIAAELADGRRLTVKRLILETMEEVLPRLKKIVLDDQAGGGVDLGLFEEDE